MSKMRSIKVPVEMYTLVEHMKRSVMLGHSLTVESNRCDIVELVKQEIDFRQQVSDSINAKSKEEWENLSKNLNRSVSMLRRVKSMDPTISIEDLISVYRHTFDKG